MKKFVAEKTHVLSNGYEWGAAADTHEGMAALEEVDKKIVQLEESEDLSRCLHAEKDFASTISLQTAIVKARGAGVKISKKVTHVLLTRSTMELFDDGKYREIATVLAELDKNKPAPAGPGDDECTLRLLGDPNEAEVELQMKDFQDTTVMKRTIEIMRTTDIRGADDGMAAKMKFLKYMQAISGIATTNVALKTSLQDLYQMARYAYEDDVDGEGDMSLRNVKSRIDEKEHRFNKPANQLDLGKDMLSRCSCHLLQTRKDDLNSSVMKQMVAFVGTATQMTLVGKWNHTDGKLAIINKKQVTDVSRQWNDRKKTSSAKFKGTNSGELAKVSGWLDQEGTTLATNLQQRHADHTTKTLTQVNIYFGFTVETVARVPKLVLRECGSGCTLALVG